MDVTIHDRQFLKYVEIQDEVIQQNIMWIRIRYYHTNDTTRFKIIDAV